MHLFLSFSQSQSDFMVICNVAKILELVIPLMDHPSENFLTTIEEDLMKLILKYGMTVSNVPPTCKCKSHNWINIWGTYKTVTILVLLSTFLK